MNDYLLLSTILLSAILTAYSIYEDKFPKPVFLRRFKRVLPLISASIIVIATVVSIVTLSINYSGLLNYPAISFIFGLLSGIILACSLAIYVVRKYIIAQYRVKIKDLMRPKFKDVQVRLKEGVESFISAKLHLNPNVTINTMARHIGTNRTYLSIYINEVYKKPFNVWIQNLRLDYAEELMRNSSVNKPLKEIANESGFLRASSLNDAFKKRHGISPGKWREEFLGPRHKPYDLEKIRSN